MDPTVRDRIHTEPWILVCKCVAAYAGLADMVAGRLVCVRQVGKNGWRLDCRKDQRGERTKGEMPAHIIH